MFFLECLSISQPVVPFPHIVYRTVLVTELTLFAYIVATFWALKASWSTRSTPILRQNRATSMRPRWLSQPRASCAEDEILAIVGVTVNPTKSLFQVLNKHLQLDNVPNMCTRGGRKKGGRHAVSRLTRKAPKTETGNPYFNFLKVLLFT